MSRAATRRDAGDARFAWIVALIAVAVLAAGLAGTLLFLDEAESDSGVPQYLRFHKLDVQASSGLAVLSFDLETDRRDFGYVEGRKALLETTFRSLLAQSDLRSYYSRESREMLAVQLRDAANRELGGPLVDAVYFGDFKLYHSR